MPGVARRTAVHPCDGRCHLQPVQQPPPPREPHWHRTPDRSPEGGGSIHGRDALVQALLCLRMRGRMRLSYSPDYLQIVSGGGSRVAMCLCDAGQGSQRGDQHLPQARSRTEHGRRPRLRAEVGGGLGEVPAGAVAPHHQGRGLGEAVGSLIPDCKVRGYTAFPKDVRAAASSHARSLTPPPLPPLYHLMRLIMQRTIGETSVALRRGLRPEHDVVHRLSTSNATQHLLVEVAREAVHLGHQDGGIDVVLGAQELGHAHSEVGGRHVVVNEQRGAHGGV
mmetsp:Transcript_12245/g.39175  ORF Transcript_12245/g.39175 Transcript_12245/m.39175 type:complete len:279 (+) Transcript_12245:214-1050(+)